MKSTKRPITLLEIMIVIFLISIIGAVLGYNMKGSLEKGKAFKTQQAINQLNDILLLESSKGDKKIEEVIGSPASVEAVLRDSELVKDPKALMKDGWGEQIKYDIDENNELVVYSEKLEDYNNKHTTVTPNASSTETPSNNEELPKKGHKKK